MKEYYLEVASDCWLPPSVKVRAVVTKSRHGADVLFVETELSRLKIKQLGGILKVRTDPKEWAKGVTDGQG